MQNSRQVTQQEYQIPHDATIVSKTDRQGNIIAANEDFIEASGYDWRELVGQPHNILRHPDVPSAVFQDFWQTLQAGKPWSQIVKNRRKNGDHYWVQANATPTFENGKISGYMSVRTQATREQIQATETLYQQIADNKVSLQNGHIRTASHQWNLWRNLNTTLLMMITLPLLLISSFITKLIPSVTEIIPTPAFLVFDACLVILLFVAALKNHHGIRQIKKYVTGISSGNFQQSIDDFGRNEIYQTLGRIKSMQIRIGADMDDAFYSLQKAKRIEHAMNAATSNIMIADRFRNIIFINEAIQKMLKAAEPELQKVLPTFDADNLLNQSIDQFHVQPHQQTKKINELKESFKTRIPVGSLTMELIISPIYDENSTRLGTVAEWRNLTDQLAVESVIEGIIESASKGKLDTQIDNAQFEGFEKNISQTVNQLLSNFNQTLTGINSVLTNMSQGDLSSRMDGEFEGLLHTMKTAINNALNNIEISLGQVQLGAIEIEDMASHVANASKDIAQRTQQQSAALEQTAASMEEITSTTEHTASNAHAANKLAQEASSAAQSGIDEMNATLVSMQGISELSSQISDITSVIDSIAFQTNLLALNAAVEAARAGEHGRGFAVVAGEVRNLAQKSADAAKDISKLISTTTEQISQGTEQVSKTSHVFEAMVEKLDSVVTQVSEVSETSREQTKGIQQINLAMTDLDQTTQQNAALVDQLSTTASDMSRQAKVQGEVIQHFEISPHLKVRHSDMSFEFAKIKIAHNTWVIRLEQLLATGKADGINRDTAKNPNLCALGKWLNEFGKNLMQIPQMSQLIEEHNQFHATVGEIIELNQQHKNLEAREKHNALATLSTKVITLINEVDQALAKDSQLLSQLDIPKPRAKQSMSHREPAAQTSPAKPAVQSETQNNPSNQQPSAKPAKPAKSAAKDSEQWDEF